MKQRVLTLGMVAIILGGCNTGNTTSKQSSFFPEPTKRSADDKIPQVADNQYVSFPAAGIKLAKPPDFENAENFHGFQQRASNSSVMVVKVPAAFSKVSDGFTAENMMTRRMILESKEAIKIHGLAGFLMKVTQVEFGIEFIKWIVAFGDESRTLLVTATMPRTCEAELSGILKSSVLSVKLDGTPAPDPRDEVRFTLAESKKLKLASGMGKMLAYTKDGTLPAKSPKEPLFVAGHSLWVAPIEDRRQFAVQRLLQTAKTKISAITSTKSKTIDGLDGFESIAQAQDVDSGTPLVVYQVILFEDAAYILMQGLVGTELADEYLPEFSAMAHSLARKKR